MGSIEFSVGARVIANAAAFIPFHGLRATNAIRRFLKAIDEPDRPVVWVSREHDVIALLARTSARGVAKLRPDRELRMLGGNPSALAGSLDISAWAVVAERLARSGLPPRMCGETALIGLEGIEADELFCTRDREHMPKAVKRLERMVAARDAAAAGAWAMWLTGSYVVAMPRPAIRHEGRFRPHAEDRPAITFAGGMALHAWDGGYVPTAWVIEQPSRITPEAIVAFRDRSSGIVALERYGWARFVLSPDADLVSDEPGIGRLFRRSVRWDFEVFAAVEVVNSTPEPDGSHRRHILSVPYHLSTAREAVAWTFGLDAHEYRPDAET